MKQFPGGQVLPGKDAATEPIEQIKPGRPVEEIRESRILLDQLRPSHGVVQAHKVGVLGAEDRREDPLGKRYRQQECEQDSGGQRRGFAREQFEGPAKSGKAFPAFRMRLINHGESPSLHRCRRRAVAGGLNSWYRWGNVSRDEILLRLRERMIHFAASQIARDVAEDLAQEVLMLLHTKYAHLNELSDLLPLSFQILRFKMHSTRRKGYRRGEHNASDVNEMPLADSRPNQAQEYERRPTPGAYDRGRVGYGRPLP